MEKDSRERFYPKLYNAMDRQFRLLQASGVGVQRKQAAIIGPEDEKQLWETQVLGR